MINFMLAEQLKKKFASLEKQIINLYPQTYVKGKWSIRRHQQAMRLMYNDRPIVECSVAELIEASESVSTVIDDLKGRGDMTNRKLRESILILDNLEGVLGNVSQSSG